jgi:NAD(P)H-dependent glutamate synthase small subunit
MSKTSAFIKHGRKDPDKKPVAQRLEDFREFEKEISPSRIATQGARCLDCGIPFCHAYGCPLGNRVPEWIALARNGHWRKALAILHATDNFPEITGRICPAPCEAACTLNIDRAPVTIRAIELKIIERGFRKGWIVPEPPETLSGKTVAVIGSGPAGLACAQQLARQGHRVTVFEKDDRIGGLMRYGIPDFKLEKRVLDRRLDQMEKEGVVFETNANVGVDILPRYLKRRFDAIVLATGCMVPRDIDVPGRRLAGIEFAMPYLTQQNRRVAKRAVAPDTSILAKGKRVVVIGGGDTGSDCVGTANRQGAKSVTQIEIMPEPPATRDPSNPWPTWPNIRVDSSSHQEGCRRMWSIATKKFDGSDGRVKQVHCAKLEWTCDKSSGQWTCKEIPQSGFTLKADLVFLAAGFVHTEHGPLAQDLNLKTDRAGNLRVDSKMMTSRRGVFAAGDSVLGASLIVRAIHSGRQVAEHVAVYLKKS